tara:strand:+ start:1324 stop:2070 length:747 start_codon:yes stop_codon:yes gene_type:complete
MSKVFKSGFALFSIFCLTLSSWSMVAHAQYRGSYTKKNEKYVDRAAPPVPKVFSSQVTSVNEAVKLDELYNELYISLWNYAITDFNYQKKLYTLVEPERFQVTRYPKEFTGDMSDGLDNLNRNYKNMLSDIEHADAQYKEIKVGIRKQDYEVLDKLWPEKIEEFRTFAKQYFGLQHKFLTTYRSLVGFIIKQGGSYYFDTTEYNVKFYQFGGYKFFGQSLDRLHKISYEQKKMLKENAPAHVDVTTIP